MSSLSLAILTPEERAILSDLALAFLESSGTTALVERSTRTPGALGEAESWDEFGTFPVVMRSAKRDSSKQVIGGRLSAAVQYLLWFPAGTDVKPGDRITIGSNQLTCEWTAPTTFEQFRAVYAGLLQT